LKNRVLEKSASIFVNYMKQALENGKP